MVMLYIEGKVSDFTVYLDHPIEKPCFITLRRCVFNNNVKNLSEEGTVSVGKDIVIKIPVGQYTFETLESVIDKRLSNLDGIPISIVKIRKAPQKFYKKFIQAHKDVVLSDSLVDLLGFKDKSLKADTRHEIQLKTLDAIFIHCDLVNPNGVLKQGAPKQILGCIELDGKKINFSPHSPIRLNATSVDYVSSLRFSVKDGDGNTISNGLYPMRLVVEIT